MRTVGGGEKGIRGHDTRSACVGVVHSQGGGVGRVVGPRLLAAKNPSACLGHAHHGQGDRSQNQIFLLHLSKKMVELKTKKLQCPAAVEMGINRW